MLTRTMLNRLIIIGFMVLVGFSLAKSIQAGSIIAVILSIVSLGAGVYFLYLLTKAQQEMEGEESA
jgi:disulfide bond formation protein DsbB